MADQGANPEIKIDVRGVGETDKKREDPAEESRKVETAVEEHGVVGSTGSTPTENRKMKDIAGFEQRYIGDIESYIANVNKSPEVATVGSGFYRVLRQVPGGSDQDIYAPTCVNFRNTRTMLMEDIPGEDTKKKLRHYYHHLNSVLNRIQRKTLEDCLLMIKRKEKEIARWYAMEEETPTDFPQLLGLLLSGCFITDLFYKWHWDEFSLEEDPECCHKWNSDLWVDLLLVENQIPLFILQDVTSLKIQDDLSFLTLEKLVYYYFNDFIPLDKQAYHIEISTDGSSEPKQFHHLLHLVHQSLLPDKNNHSLGILIRLVWISTPLLLCIFAPLLCIFTSLVCIFILLKQISKSLARLCQTSSSTQDTQSDHLVKYFEDIVNGIPGFWQKVFYKYFRKPQVLVAAIPTATRLQQAGVQIRPVEGKGFIVEFSKGVLKLPRLHVRRNTMKFLKNLIAWEQYHHEAVKYFINYAIFMDYLVNNSRDIEILIQSKVLEHSLATDEDVAMVFNTLGKDLVYTKNEESREDYDFLPQLSKELNRYCQSTFHIWKANLMNDYFGSPWSIISVVAALLIILLTMTQTFFSVYSYFRPPK